MKKKEEEIELPPTVTLGKLLKKLVAIYGEPFRNEFFTRDGKNINEETLITINGIVIGQLNDLQTKLQTGDVITLLPFFIGGG